MNLFFSIIVPAHNEEKYIEQTLTHLKELEYPKDSYEVIVVENSSTDSTREIVEGYVDQNIKLHSPEIKGVSIARNYGADLAKKDADWILFLDADTLLDSSFLQKVNDFIQKHSGVVVGAVEIQPATKHFWIKGIYVFGNLWQKMTRSPYAAFFVKRHLLNTLKFEEKLLVREDVELVKAARKEGKFFFYHTKLVQTSPRRLEHDGLFRTIIFWVFVMLLPRVIKERIGYDPVR